MKLNRIITMCAVAAALAFGVGSALAQDNGNDNGGGGGLRRGGGGGGGFGGGPGGFRNMSPEERQQFFMNNIREQLNFTNDTDWSAVQPLVQKVLDARRDMGGFGGGMRMFFGRNRGGGGQGGPGGGRGGFGGAQPSQEEEALSNALDQDAPSAQIKDLLAKYKASQQAKQKKLEQAQDALKAVLTTKQEAQAYMMGLVR